MQLTIYRSGVDDSIRALETVGILPEGLVDDIAITYNCYRVFVAPLFSGAGIKGKVIGALAYGIPTVLSPVAAEGIGLRHGYDCFIAEMPDDWARAIKRLLQGDALWRAISKAARTYATEQFSFSEGRIKMKAAFEAVDLRIV